VEAPESTIAIVEVPKSPRTLRPKKDKKAMILVRVSPRNPLRTKLTLQEKGKVINMEADEEESREILVEEQDVEMEVETQGTDPITQLPEYVPPCKGKSKVLKDIDESKSSLKNPLLLDNLVFEGLHLQRVPVLKFEDWDPIDHKKFMHLATAKLMGQRIDEITRTIQLELRTWLRGVENVGSLNLL